LTIDAGLTDGTAVGRAVTLPAGAVHADLVGPTIHAGTGVIAQTIIRVALGGPRAVDAKAQLNAHTVLTVASLALDQTLVACARDPALTDHAELVIRTQITFIELSVTIIVRHIADFADLVTKTTGV